ncbi:hypothetical protein [uncultured Dokdonia sp.]|uniref:hypothetical protein n=1 Tax=uncultured Dokdonia sp. TaxID=575653 RepID=UPI00260C14DD|nr:hypothetical protein [uncultured Dokdonia sp.]
MNNKNLLKWFGIIGSIASIASVVYIFLPNNENIEIVVNTQNVERLTQTPGDGEPNFKVDYRYKGVEIQNLWKYSIQFKNNSDKTVIGRGAQKNILMDDFTLLLKKNYTVLDYKKVISDFNNNLIVDSTNVKIAFEQWRPDEILEYSFYVKTGINIADTLLFSQPNFRQIIDGDIIFTNQIPKPNKKETSGFIPKEIKLIGSIILSIIILILIIIFTIIVFLFPFSLAKDIKWKNKNLLEYNLLVDNYFNSTQYPNKDKIDLDIDKLIYKNNPSSMLIEDFWEKFHGEKYPNTTVGINEVKTYKSILAIIGLLFTDIFLIFIFLDLVYHIIN